jgi:hypothetical protein
MQFDHFQHLHNEDSREKPRSETLASHLGSEYGNCNSRARRESRLMGKDAPPLQSVKLIYQPCSRL